MARKGGRLKSGDLAEAVADRDPVACKAVHRAAYYLGLGLGGLVNVLGPEIVIVGGGVAGASETHGLISCRNRPARRS